ncbi:MAG: acyloxyacyl hydrolase [Desulforhopalus sp.]
MSPSKIFSLSFVLIAVVAASTCAATSSQVGFGYGQQFRGNTDILQYEIFWRKSLPYTKNFGDDWQLVTGVEAGFAWLLASPSADSATARFSVMPEAGLRFREHVKCFVGFGAGYMYGETDLPRQNLGGAFLFGSKVGLEVLLSDSWGVEGVYYHQSNGGIYDYNASLNMLQVSLSYHFSP